MDLAQLDRVGQDLGLHRPDLAPPAVDLFQRAANLRVKGAPDLVQLLELAFSEVGVECLLILAQPRAGLLRGARRDLQPAVQARDCAGRPVAELHLTLEDGVDH